MGFIPDFPVGSVVTNNDIVAKFKCGNMGGMRRSKLTKTLTIISDNTKGLYEDKWVGDVLLYTGMGKSGDQELNFMQNRTLAESNSNGVEIHLFEVMKASEYTYRGPVFLYENPYSAQQVGDDGNLRSVWIFPIKLKSGQIIISEKQIEAQFQEKLRFAKRMSDSELFRHAIEAQSAQVSTRTTSSTTYIRNAFVSEFAKRRANGYCQLCKQAAPFFDSKLMPFLEMHHVIWLSNGGPDIITNAVALCPNCHRKMHVLNIEKDVEALLNLCKAN
jgi:5-methylcytosine-specific restriction protein A